MLQQLACVVLCQPYILINFFVLISPLPDISIFDRMLGTTQEIWSGLEPGPKGQRKITVGLLLKVRVYGNFFTLNYFFGEGDIFG